MMVRNELDKNYVIELDGMMFNHPHCYENDDVWERKKHQYLRVWAPSQPQPSNVITTRRTDVVPVQPMSESAKLGACIQAVEASIMKAGLLPMAKHLPTDKSKNVTPELLQAADQVRLQMIELMDVHSKLIQSTRALVNQWEMAELKATLLNTETTNEIAESSASSSSSSSSSPPDQSVSSSSSKPSQEEPPRVYDPSSLPPPSKSLSVETKKPTYASSSSSAHADKDAESADAESDYDEVPEAPEQYIPRN